MWYVCSNKQKNPLWFQIEWICSNPYPSYDVGDYEDDGMLSNRSKIQQ